MPSRSPSIFEGMTVTQLQAAYASAQQAYIELSSGSKGVNFSYAQGDGNKSVSYRPTDLPKLLMLIKQLQRELGMTCRVRRPIGFRFR